jgi:lysyl endopeptidase
VKSKALFLLLGILFPISIFSQQPIYQLSDGGTPWGSKFTQFNHEIPMMDMGEVDLDALQQEDAINDLNKNGSFRFGYNHFVNYNLNNSGVWKTLDNGDQVWRIGFYCPGATSINLAFQYLSIPEGAQLFVYTEDQTTILGAFTQKYVSPDLQLGTELLPGERVIVEYLVPSTASNVGSLEVFRVTHGYRGITDYARAFGSSGSCENNALCAAYAAYANQIKSVVCLVSGGSEFCTGALINNTCNDGTPYVLTANHCGSSGFGSWVFRFNWQAPTCTTPGSSPSSQSISGGTQRAANPGSDMSLVQINSAVPAGYNAYFAGWDRNNTASVNQVAIHHPAGDIKKVSLATGTATTATYGSATCWQTGTWTDGVTEPGSSGSPLFNTSGLIVGQLYGGPSDCTCENNAGCGYDYYGKIFTSWTGGGTNSTRLSNWLDPSGCNTGATTLVGYDPNAVSLTFDAQVQSITSPFGTLCVGAHSPVVVIKNNGTTTLTSMTINYQIDGGAATAYSWSGSLASGASANVTMPGITIAAGAHTYTATIVTGSLNGSNTDLNTGNNALTSNYTGSGGTGVALPLNEGFEGVTFPPTNWTNENPNSNVGSALWTRTTTASGYGGSTACAKIDQFSPSTNTSGQLDHLITPYLDLTTAVSPSLTFAVANARYNGTNYDSLIVWISTNCGSTWTRLASYGNNSGANQLSTAPDNTSAFTPTAAQWATKTISLSAYASQTSAQIRFQLRSGWGNNTFIDDVNVQGVPSAPPVAALTVNDNSICAGQTITYTNTSTGATSFSWTFPGGSPASGTTSPITVTYATAGTYSTTLTATNSFGTNSAGQLVTVNALPTVTSSSSYGTICDNVTPLTLTGGTPAGGTYSGTGVSGGQFNPTVSGAGTFNITYTYTDGNGCSNMAVGSIQVAPCSGIDDAELANVVLYPNPTTQFIYVTGLVNGEHLYAIITTLGQTLKTGKMMGDGAIDLGMIAHGTYYVKIDNKYWKIIKN